MDYIKLHEDYTSATPFPHIVLENFFPKEVLEPVAAEVKNLKEWEKERKKHHQMLKRTTQTLTKMPSKTKSFIRHLNSPNFLQFLEKVTGNTAIIPDPYLEGGGLHSILPGGYLNMHTDYNKHPKLGLHRILNVLIYLNKGWKEEWKGHLQLGMQTGDHKLVPPVFNTMVIFRTDDESFHGHPKPLNCPKGVSRDSIALYYFSKERKDGGVIKQTNLGAQFTDNI